MSGSRLWRTVTSSHRGGSPASESVTPEESPQNPFSTFINISNSVRSIRSEFWLVQKSARGGTTRVGLPCLRYQSESSQPRMASTTSVPGGKQPCSGSLWPPGRAPRPTADGIVCVLQNRPASADSRVRFTAEAVDAGARVAAGDERGALVVVDAARNRFERVATLDARATALAWVGDRVACAVCHPRAPRLVAVDAATGTTSEVAAAHAPGTSIATLDARDRLVVTAARDAARFWTLDGDWLRQSAFEGAGAEVAAAAVGTDGNAVVLDRDGVVHIVDSSSGQATAQLVREHTAELERVKAQAARANEAAAEERRRLIAAEADIANMANGGSRVTSRGRDDEGSRSAGHLDTFVLFFDAFESDKDVFEVFCTGSR